MNSAAYLSVKRCVQNCRVQQHRLKKNNKPQRTVPRKKNTYLGVANGAGNFPAVFTVKVRAGMTAPTLFARKGTLRVGYGTLRVGYGTLRVG